MHRSSAGRNGREHYACGNASGYEASAPESAREAVRIFEQYDGGPVRRLLVLGLFALLPACAVDIGDPESSEELGSESSGLVQEPEGAAAPDPAETSPDNPQL